MAPSFASLLDFFDAFAKPFFLKKSTAYSMFSFVSLSACLQSKKPAPVFSLKSFIKFKLFDI